MLTAISRQQHCSVSGVSSRALYQRISYTFGGASIAEDAMIQQLQQANKQCVFPELAFSQALTKFPFCG
jgi:hypothetical protein